MPEPITHSRLLEVLHYDPDSGEFTYRVKRGSRVPVGGRAGTESGEHRYIWIGIDYQRYSAHRLAWFYMTGSWPAEEVDHRDCDPYNNRWANLRAASKAQNQYNQRKPKNNTSGVKGLHWLKKKGKWRAAVAATAENGFNGYLGIYADREDAIAAIKAGRRLIHGEFANEG